MQSSARVSILLFGNLIKTSEYTVLVVVFKVDSLAIMYAGLELGFVWKDVHGVILDELHNDT